MAADFSILQDLLSHEKHLPAHVAPASGLLLFATARPDAASHASGILAPWLVA